MAVLPIVDLFLSGRHGDVTVVLGGSETQPWSPIITLIRFGLGRRARRVESGVVLHGGIPIGATHAEVHMGRGLTGGDDRINSSVHEGCKANDDLLYKCRSYGTSWSWSADRRAEAVHEGRMSE